MRSRFTEEQMVKVLRGADKTSLPEVVKKHGVKDGRLYVWRGLSCRRAWALVQVPRSSLRYESQLATKDAPVRARMCELAA